MNAMKKDLEQRRSSIVQTLQSSMRLTRDSDTGDRRAEMTKDPYGAASAAHDDELAAITMERLARDLGLIDKALADIDAGRYGTCVECEEPIAAKRLKALPFASRCVECQTLTERVARAA
jgi:DnaK suppressor protein